MAFGMSVQIKDFSIGIHCIILILLISTSAKWKETWTWPYQYLKSPSAPILRTLTAIWFRETTISNMIEDRGGWKWSSCNNTCSTQWLSQWLAFVVMWCQVASPQCKQRLGWSWTTFLMMRWWGREAEINKIPKGLTHTESNWLKSLHR